MFYSQIDNISSTTRVTHWGRVTHICVSKLIIIGSDSGLLPGRRQAIIWTNAGLLLIGPLGTNFNEILIEIYTFSFKKMHLEMSSGKWRPSCLGLNVLTQKRRICHLLSCQYTDRYDFEWYSQLMYIYIMLGYIFLINVARNICFPTLQMALCPRKYS